MPLLAYCVRNRGARNRGAWNCCARSRGITLIEMLVVLLIMGLLISVTVLSSGILRRGDTSTTGEALRVAEDLSRLFEHASQQAVAKNVVLGWSVDNNQQMRWWRWSSETSTLSNRIHAPVWVQDDESTLNIPDLPDSIELRVLTNVEPAVVFFPGKEYSAFEVYIYNVGSTRALARVWMERDGTINRGAL